MTDPIPPAASKSDDDSAETYRLSTGSQLPPDGIQPPPPLKNYVPKKPAKPKSTVWTRAGFNALVFVTSVCVMMLELTASRLIAKHVGSSLYTWTSVIGVVLAGITLGNWLGGWLSDRCNRSKALAWTYLLGSISCGSVLWLDQTIATISRPDAFTWPTWVVTVVASMFLLPSMALGTSSPIVASMALEKSLKTGSTVGNVYAWGALGSIVGTFLTGFYLIDIWGTRSIVGLTAATLAILALIVAGSARVFRTGVVLGWLQLLGWIMLAANGREEVFAATGVLVANCATIGQPQSEVALTRSSWSNRWLHAGEKFHELGLILRLRDDPLHDYHDESNYSDINVTENTVEGKVVKSLRLDKLIHAYYDPGEPTALHYDYEKVYAAVTKRVAASWASGPVTVPISGLSGVIVSADKLPDSVTLDEAEGLLRIERPTASVFTQLMAMAPEGEYWNAVEQLYRETNKPLWGGFSSVNLADLPEGIAIPDDISAHFRHDATLGVLIAYQPLTRDERDRLIAATASAGWYRNILDVQRGARQDTACFYGGGGFIFPRWFLQEFPGSPRIDVAELDPAVLEVGRKELGFTEEQEQRIHTTIGDARNFVDDRLRENVKRRERGEQPIAYDFIFADAFNDFSIPFHLTTREFLQKTHDLLSERGVFQANIIDIYPRTQYPGRSIGTASTEYQGRLPEGIVGDLKREKAVPAASKYFPLEVTELSTNHYRLSVARTISDRVRLRLLDVTWPEVKPASKVEIMPVFQAPIDPATERDNWIKAIHTVTSRSQAKQPFTGKIPEALNITGSTLEGWVPAPKPFEFVEAYRIDGDQHVLGFRGVISQDDEQRLVELDPKNELWVEAVRASAIKSRKQRAGRFMGRYLATAARVFPFVYLFSSSHKQPDANRDTFIMVCSRQALDLKSLDDTGDWTGGPFASLESISGEKEPVLTGQMRAVIGLSEGQILTDDFAPVDTLLVPVFDTQE